LQKAKHPRLDTPKPGTGAGMTIGGVCHPQPEGPKHTYSRNESPLADLIEKGSKKINMFLRLPEMIPWLMYHRLTWESKCVLPSTPQKADATKIVAESLDMAS
jgi:hypothetical protein